MGNKKLNDLLLREYIFEILKPRKKVGTSEYYNPILTHNTLKKILNKYNKTILKNDTLIQDNQLQRILNPLLQTNLIRGYGEEKKKTYSLSPRGLNYYYNKKPLKNQQDYLYATIHILYSLDLILLDAIIHEWIKNNGSVEQQKRVKEIEYDYQSLTEIEVDYLKSIFNRMMKTLPTNEGKNIIDATYAYLKTKSNEFSPTKPTNKEIQDIIKKINAEPNP